MRLAFPNLPAPPLHERPPAQHRCKENACSLRMHTPLQFWTPHNLRN